MISSAVISHSKPWIAEGDIDAVCQVLQGGMIAQGELVQKFEDSICNYLKIESGVATASGTSALVLAIKALDISKNSEVILPTYVCRSVLDAVVTVGATPVVCDIGQDWIMTIDEVEPLVTHNTSAIIAVHTFGFAVDIQLMQSLGIPVIEDACQAFGLEINGVQAGGVGDIGILSFQATKCIATGEGGMVVSNNKQLMGRAKEIRDGRKGITIRVAAPLSDLQAALGLSQLSRYNQFLQRRNKIKNIYIRGLSDIGALKLPDAGARFLFRFPLRIVRPFDVVQKNIAKGNIFIKRGVDQLIHRELGLPDSAFPCAVETFDQTISIPFYPALTDKESMDVVSIVRDVLK